MCFLCVCVVFCVSCHVILFCQSPGVRDTSCVAGQAKASSDFDRDARHRFESTVQDTKQPGAVFVLLICEYVWSLGCWSLQFFPKNGLFTLRHMRWTSLLPRRLLHRRVRQFRRRAHHAGAHVVSVMSSLSQFCTLSYVHHIVTPIHMTTALALASLMV